MFLFVAESYGYTLYSEPEHFALAEPFLRRIESRLTAAGYRIASNFLDSPAFGGNSWLADSTLDAGVRIRRPDGLRGAAGLAGQSPWPPGSTTRAT